MKQKLPRMDIYCKPGTKVIFDSPENGYPYQQEDIKKQLEVGAVYTVAYTEVHSSSTDVYLKGFNGYFNSVFFGGLEVEDINHLKLTEND